MPADEEEHRQIQASDLTLNEKLNLLTGDSLWSLPSVHGLPSLTLCDGPHGVRKQLRDRSFTASYPATCFPTAAALACSWDTDLVYDIGTALSRECDWYNVNVLLAPGMNIKRHPYGGRNFEYFSEDPFLSSRLAIPYVQGVQHSGTTAACVKHFAVNNQESHRFVVNAVVDPRTLHELYLEQFRVVLKQAQPAMVMTAYNQLNGIYCSEHEYLLKTILRDTDHWEGVTVSDWGATNARVTGLIAGLDLEMPGSHGVHNAEFRKCLDDGTLEMGIVDTSVNRILNLIRTYGTKPPHDPNVSEDKLFRDHSALAHSAALESIVLLKNDANVLPLDVKNIHSIALIGEFGKDHPRYQGMGSSMVNSTKVKSVYTALRDHFNVDQIHYAHGYHPDDEALDGTDESLLQEAATAAAAADAVILCIGLPEIMESEGFDRTHLSIPSQHAALVDIACANNQNVIVVLSNGGVIELPWFDGPSAIVETYLSGEAGGPATVDVIFGKSTPCGKLAESWPLQAFDLMADEWFPGSRDVVEYREGLNVGYRHLDTENACVQFPFGFGLSYTNFGYRNVEIKVNQDEQTTKQVVVTLQVENTGTFPGREIVQVYVRHTNPSIFRPTHELQGFTKTKLLQPGETSETMTIILSEQAFSYYDPQTSQWILEKSGVFEIQVAAHSRDIRHAQSIQFALGDEPLALTEYESFADRFQCRDSVRSAIELRNDIHRNSLLKDVAGQRWLGRMLLSVVFQAAMKEVAPNSKNPAREKKLVEATVSNLPLRALVLFSKGAFSFDLLDALILLMNLRYFAAIVGFGRALYRATFGRMWSSSRQHQQ